MKAERLTENPKHDAAARCFFERQIYEIQASRTTDPQEKAALIRAAEDRKQAAHRHLEGLGQEETKAFHKAKAAEHQAREEENKHLMDNATTPQERKKYAIRARSHNAFVKVRNHLAEQHP